MHQIGCWRPEPVKWKVTWHRRSGDKRRGLEEASLQRASGDPPCNTLLCNPVAEGWLASVGPLVLWLSGLNRSCLRQVLLYVISSTMSVSKFILDSDYTKRLFPAGRIRLLL